MALYLFVYIYQEDTRAKRFAPISAWVVKPTALPAAGHSLPAFFDQ